MTHVYSSFLSLFCLVEVTSSFGAYFQLPCLRHVRHQLRSQANSVPGPIRYNSNPHPKYYGFPYLRSSVFCSCLCDRLCEPLDEQKEERTVGETGLNQILFHHGED